MVAMQDFRRELEAQFGRAEKQERPHIEINAGELHRVIGGYPPKSGASHRMPACCETMWQEFKKGRAEVIHETDSRQSAALTIRYALPRPR